MHVQKYVCPWQWNGARCPGSRRTSQIRTWSFSNQSVVPTLGFAGASSSSLAYSCVLYVAEPPPRMASPLFDRAFDGPTT
jgi:hypothetical protein